MALDFSKIPNYANRQMFLDPAGPVTIQRYEDFAFPVIAEYLQTQKGAFWIPEEVTLTKDQMDFREANETVRHIFSANLLRQTALDSEQGRSPAQIFTPVCSVPEVEALVQWWSSFEQIHSTSYSHIIKNIYNVPVEQFNAIHDTPEIIGMLSSIDKYYNDLHILNSKKAVYDELRSQGIPDSELGYVRVTEHQHIKAIWMAMIASYGLEAIRFMVSFATSLVMKENNIFIGSCTIISLILQDEILHTKWTAYIINTLIATDPRFKEISEEMKQEAHDALISVIDEEKQWAKHLFKKGPMSGLNEKIMVDFVDHRAPIALAEINVKIPRRVKSTPLPWYNKYLTTNKKQVALQENESDSYVLGSLLTTVDYTQLPQF